MDWLQKLLLRVWKQLRGLTISQRLAILLGGVLVAVSIVGMIRWAASPELVPLLRQDLAPDELTRAVDGLDQQDQTYKLVGQKILVPAAANKQAILARLQQQDKLPADTSPSFSALVKEANPWISQAEHERRWSVALKHEIEKVLRQFEGVKSASVFLPLTSQSRGFARNAPATSASVTLVMQGGRPVSRELALAAARLVVGAVRGLALKNVEVLDGNGGSALDWDSESAGITALDRKRRAEEQAIQKKIVNQLADPKVLVSVQVELDLTEQNIESETLGKPFEKITETTREETTRVRDSGQPGVQPNVGLAAGGRTADERTEKETAKSEFLPPVTRERKATPSGGVKEVWAAVRISRSYLESIFKQAHLGPAAPTEPQIQEQFEKEKPRVLSQVTKLVKPQDEEHVDVSWYYDAAADVQAPSSASVLDDTFHLVRRYGPPSGLGLLALFSLGLMLRLARKSDSSEAFGLEIGLPKEAIEAAEQAARDASVIARQRAPAAKRSAATATGPEGYSGVMEVGPSAVGQAAVTEGVLVAQEVDEKTVQTHKMLEQVAQVVETDPDGSSALLEQWVQRSDAISR